MSGGIWLGEATDVLYPAVMDWIHHPSQASKRALFEAYADLPPKAKAAYDADVEGAFRREHGATATVYRYKAREDMSGASVSPVRPRDSTLHKAFEIRPGDVLVHYGQDEMPLGGKAFGHEKEIILRKDARPSEIRTAYSYDCRVAKKIDLSQYGLEGMPKGMPTTLYHGTTKLFRRFDINTSRDELVDRFYGKGIFLSPYKRIAEQYADANRNIGFDPSIIDDLKRKNANAGWFLRLVYERGAADVWEDALRESGFWRENPAPGQGQADMVGFVDYLGVDPNELVSIAEYTIGSKERPLGDDSALSLFNTSTGAPAWLYDTLDRVGLNSKVYRPKVYTVTVRVSNTLVTASKSQARSAHARGYDSVVYYGSDLVGGVPEVAIFDPKSVRITKIEIV